MQTLKRFLILLFCILPVGTLACLSFILLLFPFSEFSVGAFALTLVPVISGTAVAGLAFGTFVDKKKWLNYPKLLVAFCVAGLICVIFVACMFTGLLSEGNHADKSAASDAIWAFLVFGPAGVLGTLYLYQASRLLITRNKNGAPIPALQKISDVPQKKERRVAQKTAPTIKSQSLRIVIFAFCLLPAFLDASLFTCLTGFVVISSKAYAMAPPLFIAGCIIWTAVFGLDFASRTEKEDWLDYPRRARVFAICGALCLTFIGTLIACMFRPETIALRRIDAILLLSYFHLGPFILGSIYFAQYIYLLKKRAP